MATRRTTKAKTAEKATEKTAAAKPAASAKSAASAKATTVAKSATAAKAAKAAAKAAKTVAAAETVEQVGKAVVAAKKTTEAVESKASALALEIAEELKQAEEAVAKEAAPKEAAPKEAPAKKTPAKRASAKKTPAKKAAAKKAPTKEPPAEKAPVEEPSEQKLEEALVADASAEQTSVEEKIEEKAPAAEAPVEAVSAAEQPAEEQPAEEQPAEEQPAEEATAEEAPVEEPEAEDAPAEDTPEQAADQEAVEQVEEAPVVLPEFSDVPGVLIAAAECAPLVKVGGLADVVGALPKYLKKLGIDARIIMPFHRSIKERYCTETQHICDFQASLGWRSQYVGVERLELDGTIYYFIDNEFYFGGPVYCGGEFEGEQYAFFTRAVLDSIPQLDFDVKILHCNDWHTAMMPLLVRTQYQGGMQAGLRTLLTIHNLHFQGQFSHEFDRDLLGVDDSLATPQFVEHYGCDNMLKAGIVFANKVNTVSPTYAREICEPELGESLEGVLRSRGGDLSGILNGIDVDVWDPQNDPALPQRYSAKSLWRKLKNREALLEELGLAPAGENTAVIAMVGRLTAQKGIDLVKWVLDDIMAEDVRMIILGSGDPDLEGFLRDAENRYKGRLCSYIGYAGELSHRIYAGSDLFLMPSLFEPCGISQMISMRYGTLPIVRETGGLRDTVIPYNQYTGEGNGFSFANYNAGEMLDCIRYALWVWRNEDARKQLIKQAMESDFSFDRCARAYAELYRSL